MSGLIGGADSKSGVIGQKGDGWVKLVDQSGTSNRSFDCFTSDYSVYKIFYYQLYTNVDGASFYVRYRRNNADHSAAGYRFVLHNVRTNSSSFVHGESVRGWGDTNFRINGVGVDNSLGHGLDAELTIINPWQAGTYKKCRIQSYQQWSDLASAQLTHGMAVDTNTDSPLTGMTVYPSGGNYEGKILVYGIKN